MVNNVVVGSGFEIYYVLCEYIVVYIGWSGDIVSKFLIIFFV